MWTVLRHSAGPFHLIGRVLRKRQEEEVDNILVCPKWPKGQRAQLRELPIVKVKRGLGETRQSEAQPILERGEGQSGSQGETGG